MDLFVQNLDQSCWNILAEGVYQTVSLSLIPTFYHSGGVFQLKYFDQMTRDGPQILFQNGANGILLRVILDDTFTAIYNGSNQIYWTGSLGKSMIWSKTTCWTDFTKTPSTPLVGL